MSRDDKLFGIDVLPPPPPSMFRDELDAFSRSRWEFAWRPKKAVGALFGWGCWEWCCCDCCCCC
jgi:hypothetical protein